MAEIKFLNMCDYCKKSFADCDNLNIIFECDVPYGNKMSDKVIGCDAFKEKED